MSYSRWALAVLGGAALFASGYYCRSDGPAAAAREVSPARDVLPSREPVPPVTVTALRPPSAAAPSPLPVTVGRRPAAVGKAFVGVVRNTGASYLRLSATYTNVTTGKTTKVTVSVGPNETTELGWLDGCPFASGDTLTLAHPNFQSHTWEF